MAEEISVTRNDEASRYEVHVGDRVGGFLVFASTPEGPVILPHTQIDPEYKGMGLGSTLAAEALADLARRGDPVIPRCPFVAHYLQEHEVPGLVVQWPDREDAEDAATPPESA